MSKLFSSNTASRRGADADAGEGFLRGSSAPEADALSTSVPAFYQNGGFPLERGGIYLARL